jgi:uncharacterized protein (DUF169 family)
MAIEEFSTRGMELKNLLALQRPVGLKFCKDSSEIPAKARRPLRDFHIHMSLCQAINQSRAVGYTIAMQLDDMYCAIGASLFGLADFEFTFFPHHVKDEAAGCRLDAVYQERNAMLPAGTFNAVVVSPLDRLAVEPDVIIAYGVPGQIGKIAKAFTWHGEAVQALYLGGAGCSAVVLSYTEWKPVIALPAGGEKVLAGTNDYEMDIVFPADRLEDVLSGLKATQKMLPYPTVCSTLINEPVVPADYPITYKDLPAEH